VKWFKHLTGSIFSPEISELIERHGSIGYHVFFGVLEIYATEYNPELGWKLVTTRRYLKENLGITHYKLLENSLQSIRELCGWEIEITDTHYSIIVPKFNALVDEVTQKKVREYNDKFGNNSLSIPAKRKIKKEDEEEDIKELTPYREGTDYFLLKYKDLTGEVYPFTKVDGSIYARLYKLGGLELFKKKVDMIHGQFLLEPQRRIFKLRDKSTFTFQILSTVWAELVDGKQETKRIPEYLA
jgi:hypothetical protein